MRKKVSSFKVILIGIMICIFYTYIFLPITAVDAKNSVDSTEKYSQDYRYWSQGASKYSEMRLGGCRLVAFAKLLSETGYTDFHNPDAFYKYAYDNGYCYKSCLEATSTVGQIIIDYIEASGDVTVEHITVALSGNTDEDNARIMSLLEEEYYIVLTSAPHTVYIDRGLSLLRGESIISDSWNNTIQSTYTIIPYRNYSLVKLEKIHAYRIVEPEYNSISISYRNGIVSVISDNAIEINTIEASTNNYDYGELEMAPICSLEANTYLYDGSIAEDNEYIYLSLSYTWEGKSQNVCFKAKNESYETATGKCEKIEISNKLDELLPSVVSDDNFGKEDIFVSQDPIQNIEELTNNIEVERIKFEQIDINQELDSNNNEIVFGTNEPKEMQQYLYRYRTVDIAFEEKTVDMPVNNSNWELVEKKDEIQYGPWSEWSSVTVSLDDENIEIESKVDIQEVTIGVQKEFNYHYYYYFDEYGTKWFTWSQTYAQSKGGGDVVYRGWGEELFLYTLYDGVVYGSNYLTSQGQSGIWFYEEMREVPIVERTESIMYRTRKKQSSTKYIYNVSHVEIGEWSDWSSDIPPSDENIEVETMVITDKEYL